VLLVEVKIFRGSTSDLADGSRFPCRVRGGTGATLAVPEDRKPGAADTCGQRGKDNQKGSPNRLPPFTPLTSGIHIEGFLCGKAPAYATYCATYDSLQYFLPTAGHRIMPHASSESSESSGATPTLKDELVTSEQIREKNKR